MTGTCISDLYMIFSCIFFSTELKIGETCYFEFLFLSNTIVWQDLCGFNEFSRSVQVLLMRFTKITWCKIVTYLSLFLEKTVFKIMVKCMHSF